MKTKKWKDLLSVTWTSYIFLVSTTIVGAYFSTYEGKRWGSWLFLLSFIIAILAARRAEKIETKKLKGYKKIALGIILVAAILNAVGATLYYRDNVWAFVGLLSVSVFMFIFSIGFEMYFLLEQTSKQ